MAPKILGLHYRKNKCPGISRILGLDPGTRPFIQFKLGLNKITYVTGKYIQFEEE